MKKLIELLISQRCMTVVNGLFFLAAIFTYNGMIKGGLLFIAYFAWLAYLVFCAKNAASKGSKITFSVIIVIVVILICVNLYFYVRKVI
ncbi:MAG: hypothetical protein GXY20_11835 [Clostridiales bacterium]|nr:hypothetical protein [Clostridiales bacterium]